MTRVGIRRGIEREETVWGKVGIVEECQGKNKE